ncbi:NAD(P)H-dependent oxidoreductase [Clostridium botulinum]|uniref:NAD(P)H-dependent oxidoreductase n=1 Tax=Clostridium botulinum TaxID=1491 RepID=UPI003DA26389
MITIIFSHPCHGSFNKAVLDTITTALEKKKKEYQIIDLNKDNFNPVITEGELALYLKGQHEDPLVTKYQNMLKNFEYTESSTGLKGKLTHIKSTKMITTGQSPRWYAKCFAGNMIQKTFINATLKGVGIKNAKWFHCGDVSKGAQVKREKFL